MEEKTGNLNPTVFQAKGNSSEPLIAESSNLNSSMATPPGTTLEEKRKRQREEFDKIFSHRDVLDLMLHAFQCELPEWQDPDCHEVKEMYRNGIQVHGTFCKTRASGALCDLCPKMWYFLGLHSQNCKKEWCYVPQCRYLKDRAKMYEKSLQTYQQKLQTFPLPLQTFQQSMHIYKQPLQNFKQSVGTYQQPLQTFQQPLQAYQQPLHTFQQPWQSFQPAAGMVRTPKLMEMQSSQTTIAGSSNQTVSSLITNNQANHQAYIEKWRKQREEFNKMQSEEFDKLFSHRDVLDLLLHAFQCELPQCQDPDCILIKEMYSQGLKCHGLRCTVPTKGGCDPCTKLWYFLKLHARNCKKECCYVPHCSSYLKHSMKSIPVPGLPMKSIPVPGLPYCMRFPQDLQTFPALRGMARKRAAEATPGTADNQKKSQKISINSIPSTSSNPFTTSTSLTETVTGSHQFKITGYSLLKGLGLGKYIASETFDAGGYKWAIHFYPDGKNLEDNAGYVSCFIALASEGTDVRALFELALLDQSGKERHKVHSHFEARTLENGPYKLKYRGSMWGYKRFYKRTALEVTDYLKDDCLILHCKVGVVKSHTEGSKKEPPPEDIGQHSGELLEREQAAEAVGDKMGAGLSVAEAVVDEMDEKEVVVDKMHHLSITEAHVLDAIDEHHRFVDDEWTLI